MIEEALSYVDPYERDTWVRMGMAIKSELGDSGFDLWDTWSQTANNYTEASAKAVWRSLNAAGAITIGSLYFEAKEGGWTGSGRRTPNPPRRTRNWQDDGRAERQANAREQAQAMIDQSIRAPHDYLARKGFPDEVALCLNGSILIPMRDAKSNQLNSVQTINTDGRKKFLAGGKASGSVFKMGAGPKSWLVEGFATGLSVRAALRSMYSTDAVVVCFSAGNLSKVSGSYVIADNDASEAGQRAAEKAGLPWWMPPWIGDANDFHLKHGLPALAAALRDLRVSRFDSHQEQKWVLTQSEGAK